MNKLHHNPNVRRFGLPLAVTAALLGGTACSNFNSDPMPDPSETTTSAQYIPPPTPSCVVKIGGITGRKVVVRLDTKNDYVPGAYSVEKVEYDFGDEQTGEVTGKASTSHTYTKPGKYRLEANMVMNVAPEVDAPFPDKAQFRCEHAKVIVM